ncbi:hypothetical protein KC352_g36103, partial [Hortaea werneckii]
MAQDIVKEEDHKRKADNAPNGDSNEHDSKRFKSSASPQPEPAPDANDADNDAEESDAPARVPFPEKPAVLEERNGDISFQVVNNDNQPRSMIILTGLKCIFQKQLPKMPKDYIARLVYDRT